MSLPRDKRSDQSAEDLFHYLEEHIETEEYGWASEIAFGIAQIGVKDDIEATRDFIDEVAAPLIQDYHESVMHFERPSKPKYGSSYEGNGPDINQDWELWRQKLSGASSHNNANHISPKARCLTKLRDNVEHNFHEEIDYVVGITSGGIAPAYTLSDILDAEVTLETYSPYRREDNKVFTPSIFETSYTDSDVLVADDMIETGETLRVVGQHLLDKEAESLYATVAYPMQQWSIFDSDEVVILKDGEIT